MKTKKFSKKLSLNKKTIADLNSNEMKEVHGGQLAIFTETCRSCYGSDYLACCPGPV